MDPVVEYSSIAEEEIVHEVPTSPTRKGSPLREKTPSPELQNLSITVDQKEVRTEMKDEKHEYTISKIDDLQTIMNN